MPTWIRSALALLAGVVIAGLIIASMEAFGHGLLQGQAIFVAPVLGYFLGTAAGSWSADFLSRSTSVSPPVLLCAIVLVLALANLTALPHPVWFAPVAIVSVISGGFIGWVLRRKPKAQP